jgi:hypothetical protein
VSGRGRGPSALGAAIARLTKPLFAKRGLADGAIVAEWGAIVGPALAEASAPEKIVYPSGQGTEGTLHLRIASGGLAVELQHLQPLLLERINSYFGYRAAARLKLIQGPVPKPPPCVAAPPHALTPAEEEALAQSLAGVTDADLRACLDALGRAILARGPATRRPSSKT